MTNDQQRQLCYLGLGSNLKNPTQQITTAIKHLNNLSQTEFRQSAPWYLSKAWGVTDQHDFVNTVVVISTSLTPLALLQAIKKIEYRLMQRQVNRRWHARCIDIDILLYGQQRLNRTELTIPHQHIANRCFVLEPLMKLQPKLTFSLRKSINQHQKNHTCVDSLKLLNWAVNDKNNVKSP